MTETATGRKYVLIVEDEASVRDFVSNAAGDCYEVGVAPTLALAEAAVGKRVPDAIILDLDLPCSTGIATYQRMHRACPRVPIVVFAGHDEGGKAAIITAGGRVVENGGAASVLWHEVGEALLLCQLSHDRSAEQGITDGISRLKQLAIESPEESKAASMNETRKYPCHKTPEARPRRSS